MNNNTLISPMMMALRLTVMLYHPEVDPEAYEAARVVSHCADGCSGYWITWFGHHDRYAEIIYPTKDLTLSMEAFAERHLHEAARLLIG